MIITARPKIPFLWQLVVAVPWAALNLKTMTMGAVFVFSLRKFVENPAGMTFIMSVPLIISIIVSPACSFLSDRIWTRFGRRKPFIVVSWIGTLAMIVAIPLAGSFPALVATFFLFTFFNDIGSSPTETLKQEVVPPKQRGTATAIGQWIGNIGSLLFYLIAVGRFDDFGFFAGMAVTGEQSIYWGVAAALSMMLLLVMLGIKEVGGGTSGQERGVGAFFRGITNRQLWPVYLLITGWAFSHSGLGALSPLLYTEQWGFSKQEMGINIAIGGFINIFLIAFIGWLADRLPRMKAYKVLLGIYILLEVAFFAYVEWALPDKTPTLLEVVLFGELMAVTGILLNLIYYPLVYDYVPRNEMGTYAAGAGLVNKMISVLTLNGVGIFVTLHATWFLPPGGETVRVATAQVCTGAEIRSRLAAIPGLSVEVWSANNTERDKGCAFEIRQANPDTVALKKTRDQMAARPGTQDEIRKIDMELDERGDSLLKKVRAAIPDLISMEGTGIREARSERIEIREFELTSRPAPADVDRSLRSLRALRPDVVALVVRQREGSYFVEASLLPGGGEVPLEEAIEKACRSHLRGALPNPVNPSGTWFRDAVSLELTVVENPMNPSASPVTSVVNAVWGLFGDPPSSDRRIQATTRAIRSPGLISHAAVYDSSVGNDHRVRIVALYDKPPEAATEAIDKEVAVRLREALPALAHEAIDLHRRTLRALTPNRITVLDPVLFRGFAPMRYDYMSGYLWMIVMSILGLVITFFFSNREEKGLIHKRGREESEAEAKAEAEVAASHGVVEFYTPRHVPQKIGMVAFGCCLVLLGLAQLAPELGVLLRGTRESAEAIRVVKERPGEAAQVFADDASLNAARETRDRSFVFWNEYRVHRLDAPPLEFRAPAGKQLGPEHPLLDADGNPHSVTVFFDPSHPHRFVIPSLWSTWFLPGILILFGTIGVVTGALLLAYANKLIPLPVIR